MDRPRLNLIEHRPLLVAGAIFLTLAIIHLLLLNIAGVANVVFIGDQSCSSLPDRTRSKSCFWHSSPTTLSCPRWWATPACAPTTICGRPRARRRTVRPSSRRAASMHFSLWRLGFGLFWAVILTPVFGDLFRAAVPGEGWGAALLTIWLYVRIALIFGLLGASIIFVALLHHRFRDLTGRHLRVDLFDLAPLQPIARYARNVALFLIVLLALAGPAIAQPEAMYRQRRAARPWRRPDRRRRRRRDVGRAPRHPRRQEDRAHRTSNLCARAVAPRLCRRPHHRSRRHSGVGRDADCARRDRARQRLAGRLERVLAHRHARSSYRCCHGSAASSPPSCAVAHALKRRVPAATCDGEQLSATTSTALRPSAPLAPSAAPQRAPGMPSSSDRAKVDLQRSSPNSSP